jgi:hypothetical protein
MMNHPFLTDSDLYVLLVILVVSIRIYQRYSS